MSGSHITIKGPDGPFSAYVAKPRSEPAPAVVVLQEIFGVNKVMRDLCDGYARAGYLAVCPDLFWRIEPGIDITDQTDADWARAFELFKAFNIETGVADIAATIDQIRQDPACSGKVGAVGYCLGGLLAYLTACRTSADAVVGYYGVALDQYLDETKSLHGPLMLHIATKDEFVPPPSQRKVHAALDGNPKVILHDYDGQDHAFARVGGAHYNETAAGLANERTAVFLAKNLK